MKISKNHSKASSENRLASWRLNHDTMQNACGNRVPALHVHFRCSNYVTNANIVCVDGNTLSIEPWITSLGVCSERGAIGGSLEIDAAADE